MSILAIFCHHPRHFRAILIVVFMEMQGSIHGFTTLRKAIPSAQADMQRIFAAMRLMLDSAR